MTREKDVDVLRSYVGNLLANSPVGRIKSLLFFYSWSVLVCFFVCLGGPFKWSLEGPTSGKDRFSEMLDV